ncbi:uncharacterized protein [Amphiura filiformis]|uniref:uncharacterized protein n=1 Tax=Amphiura filiformis TaxID=82378 RepID=UPI003B225DDB
MQFDGSLPKPFPCLRGNDSCPALNGIDESCGEGYEGWLCSRCSIGFYSWFDYCIKCPPMWHLILEGIGTFIFVCIVVAITVCDIKRRKKTTRSLMDIVVARFKILLGYYQIAGAIFTSLHNIHWPQEISNLASLFQVLELNIFQLIAKPRCLANKLELNIYSQFIIGLIFGCFVLTVPCLVYSCIYFYLQVKLSKYGRFINRNKVRNYLTHLRSKCYLFIVMMLFITYLSFCDVILSLLPVSCRKFCVDENSVYCTERLRSDYSIDCATSKHMDYIKAAYFALLYVVGFPVVLFIVILKNSPRKLRELQENQEDEESDESLKTEESIVEADSENSENNDRRENPDECTAGNDDTESMRSIQLESSDITNDVNAQTNSHKRTFPLYIRFLCENYKAKYWYWEIVELSRKVLQISLIVSFGSEDPVTLGATIALSVIFLTSHAYFKPMKDSFEHWLQMTSLLAIFLNLLCAEVLLVPITDPSGYRQTAMAVLIITLNVSVVLLVVGNSVLILWRSVKQHGRNGMCSCHNCLTIVTDIVSGVSDVSRNRRANNRNSAVI